jgi:hypothetical protein
VIEISTPVTVHNPVQIDTSDKRLALGSELLSNGGGPGLIGAQAMGLNALADNFLANTANAAGNIISSGKEVPTARVAASGLSMCFLWRERHWGGAACNDCTSTHLSIHRFILCPPCSLVGASRRPQCGSLACRTRTPLLP